MSDLVAFLRARLDEDEATARAATPGSWFHNPKKEWSTDLDKLRAARAGVRQGGGEEFVGVMEGERIVGVAATGPADDLRSMADADHIARHDPARVLRDVEAKRRIVEQYERAHDYHRAHPGALLALHWTVKLLALPYADHLDYREEWEPC